MINEYVYVLGSKARTASVTTNDFINGSGRGLHCVVDVTSVTASGSITVEIDGKDRLSGQYYSLLGSAAYATSGTRVLRIYPGLTAQTNLTVSDVLPGVWRVKVTAANSDSVTYSIGASVIE